MIEDMKRAREEMSSMVQDVKDKQEKSELLTEELRKLPKNINRMVYTHRILDIIASVAKQNEEIDRITSDIRDIQKTINSSSSALQRADAVTEERIFTVATGSANDSSMVNIYRQLRALRASFEELILTIGKIGQLDKQARDFETKIDQEVSRVSSNNIERIFHDLEEVLAENTRLISAIKSM